MQCHFFVFQWCVPVSDVLSGACQVTQIIAVLLSLSLDERNGEAPRSQTEEGVSEEPRRDGERAEGSAEGRRGRAEEQSLEIRGQEAVGTEKEESEKECGEGKLGLWKNNSIPFSNWIKCLWHEKWLLNKNLPLQNTEVQTPAWDFLILAWAFIEFWCWLSPAFPHSSWSKPELTDFRSSQTSSWECGRFYCNSGQTQAKHDGSLRRNRKIKYLNTLILCCLSSAPYFILELDTYLNIIFNVRVEWMNKNPSC